MFSVMEISSRALSSSKSGLNIIIMLLILILYTFKMKLDFDHNVLKKLHSAHLMHSSTTNQANEIGSSYDQLACCLSAGSGKTLC